MSSRSPHRLVLGAAGANKPVSLSMDMRNTQTFSISQQKPEHVNNTQHATTYGGRHRIPVYLPGFPTHTSTHTKLKGRDRNHSFIN